MQPTNITDEHIARYGKMIKTMNETSAPSSELSTLNTTSSSLSRHPYHIRRIEIKDPEYMSEVPEYMQNKDIPGFPTTVVVIGEPGSGKTNLLMNLLTRKDLWNGFYDRIYLLGPTVKTDKLYQAIKIPDSQKVTDEAEFIPKLTEWVDEQKARVKDNPSSAPKTLFLFEDFTSYRETVQLHPNFRKCFNAIRHHKATAYANIHKITALERTARLNCRHVIVFPVNKTEQDQLHKDYSVSGLGREDFYILCDDAWAPDDSTEKPFLYINKYAPPETRFRKCFTQILNLSYYKGLHYNRRNEKRETTQTEKRQKRDQEKELASDTRKRKRAEEQGLPINKKNKNGSSSIPSSTPQGPPSGTKIRDMS